MYYNNLTLLTDLYQITMMQAYFSSGKKDQRVIFDLFFRKNPNNNGYSIAAGLEQAIEYIKNIKFSESDIKYLKSLNRFSDDFLLYLKDFKFNGNIYAIPEGTVVFPGEPLVIVEASIIEAQFIETTLLNIINHQSLIATKAARIIWATDNGDVLEFGIRRAQGPDAAVYGARAAMIGGCRATSNVLAGKLFNVPIAGTHAHSFIMSFPDELTAFREYAKTFPKASILLVDTYDTLTSGIPNAITVFKEMREQGIELTNYGIRLDSGDFAYLSKKARKILDDNGFYDAVICASSDLDEHLIINLKHQGAEISLWGVGTSLITSKDCPAFGGVYKLSAHIDKNNECIPKIKVSDNTEKITNPGFKKIFRLYDKNSQKMKADLITLYDEEIDQTKDLTIFHPISTWKKMTLKANCFYAKELLVQVFKDGNCVYNSPSVMEIRDYCKEELNTLWDEFKRITNPHILPVDLSLKLYNLKKKMLEEIRHN